MDPSQNVAYCTNIPTEVWVRCWSLSSSRDLRRLVFVCRHFRDICQPLLFQHQHFRAPDPEDIDRGNWMLTTRDLHRSSIRLKKLVASAHVSSVRSWQFHGNFEFPDLAETYPNVLNIGLVDKTYLNMVRIFAGTLGVHQNLRSLCLDYLTIDAPFRETLASLGRLEELTFDSCDIISRRGPLLSLQNFTLERSSSDHYHNHYCDEPLDIVSPDTLRVLNLDGCRDSRALLSVLANQSLTFNNLITLSVEVSDSAAKPFLAFLEHCPQLARLEIYRSLLSGPIQDRVSPTAIPLLRSFKGPRLLAGMFIFDRPVAVVELSDDSDFSAENKAAEKDIIRDLADIAHSSVAVHSLSMAAPMQTALKILTAIATHFPEMQELALGLREPPPAPKPWVPHNNIDDDTDAASSVAGSEVEVDEGTLELSENESLESISSFGYSPIILVSDDEEENAPAIPEVLVPGHMYTTSGRVFPPAATPPASTLADPESFSSLIDCICAEHASLPASLVSLRFTQPSLWHALRQASSLTLADQHRAVLAFERQLPALRELAFGVDSSVWTRYRDTWTQKRTGTKIASLGSGGDQTKAN
ncbi:hypothetical protein B0H10DRAFT_2047347 [Mycena sp. CBHHK59/15]|nr:hypothetical protein B0H10DRAFT_2047347 [Mycena sp. CBHHK59/15]